LWHQDIKVVAAVVTAAVMTAMTKHLPTKTILLKTELTMKSAPKAICFRRAFLVIEAHSDI